MKCSSSRSYQDSYFCSQLLNYQGLLTTRSFNETVTVLKDTRREISTAFELGDQLGVVGGDYLVVALHQFKRTGAIKSNVT